MAEETEQPPKGNLYKLWSSVRGKVNVPDDFSVFERAMSDGNNLKTFYEGIKGKVNVPPDYNVFEAAMRDGTKPAEKKNESTVSQSPLGGMPSLSASNPFEQKQNEVLGLISEPVTKTGLSATPSVSLTGATNAEGTENVPYSGAAPDITNVAGQKPKTTQQAAMDYTLTGNVPTGYEDAVKFTPKEETLLKELDLSSDLFGNDANSKAFKQLARTQGFEIKDDTQLLDPDFRTQILESAITAKNVDTFDKIAKEKGIDVRAATDIVRDNVAQYALNETEQKIYDLQKSFGEQAKNATPEEFAKLQTKFEAEKNKLIDSYDTEIKKVDEQIFKGISYDTGRILSPKELSDLKTKRADLKAQYLFFKKSPETAAKEVLGKVSTPTYLQKKLEGKSPLEKAQTVLNSKLAELYVLSDKVGVGLDDIMATINNPLSLKSLQTGFNAVKTSLGIGDIFGYVTGEDRVRLGKLIGEIKTLAPIALINKSPFTKSGEDTTANILPEAGTNMLVPAVAGSFPSGQTQAGQIRSFLGLTNLNDEVNPDVQKTIESKLEPYGLSNKTIGLLGGVAQIVIPAMAGGVGVEAGLATLSKMPYVGTVINMFRSTKLGEAAVTGLKYEAGSKVFQGTAEELDFGSGAVGDLATSLLPELKFISPVLQGLFGKAASKVVPILNNAIKAGTGELAEETAQTLFQVWRDTPQGQSFRENLEKQFGSISDVLFFALSTFVMGAAMKGAADFSTEKIKEKLSPEDQARYDAFVQTSKEDASDLVKTVLGEVIKEASGDDLTKAAESTKTAIDELTEIANGENYEYKVEVDGVEYSGNTQEELQTDIDFLKHTNQAVTDELYKRETETTPTEQAAETNEQQPKPEAGVGAEGEPTQNIEIKQKETEAKIKQKDLFRDGGLFANELGGSGENSVPTRHLEKNGIEFVEFSNPTTGVVDVIMTGTSDNDFVGYYRLYENGKPTNKWSSKFENQSRNKDNFKTMISGVQDMLPQGHEYTEKTSISTDGLRVWGQQLNRGYELQRDANGKIKTNRVAINGDAIVNELGIPVNRGNFDNVSVTNNADMKKVKAALLPYLQKFGLGENNIHFENGTVEIDLPVLKKTATTQANRDTTTKPKPLIKETPQNFNQGEPLVNETEEKTAQVTEPVTEKQVPSEQKTTEGTTPIEANIGEKQNAPKSEGEPTKKITTRDIPSDVKEGDVDEEELFSLFEDTEREDRIHEAAYQEGLKLEQQAAEDVSNETGTKGVLSAKEAAIHDVFGKADTDSFKRFGDSNNLKGGKRDFTFGVKRLQFLMKKGGMPIDEIAQLADEKLGGNGTITTDDVVDYMMDRAANTNKYKSKAFDRIASKIREGKQDLDTPFSALIPPQIWNAALEGIARTVEKTGDLVYATKLGIAYIKQTDWYKKLSEGEQKQAIEDLRNHIIESNNVEEAPISDTQIDELLKGGSKRNAVLKDINPELEPIARKITNSIDLNHIKNVLANVDGKYDKQLALLEKKLGFKKIC